MIHKGAYQVTEPVTKLAGLKRDAEAVKAEIDKYVGRRGSKEVLLRGMELNAKLGKLNTKIAYEEGLKAATRHTGGPPTGLMSIVEPGVLMGISGSCHDWKGVYPAKIGAFEHRTKATMKPTKLVDLVTQTIHVGWEALKGG